MTSYTVNKARIIFCLLMALLFISFSFSAAAETDNLLKTLHGQELHTHIANYAALHIPHQDDETIEVTPVKLNQNLTLPSCSTDIDISISKQSANSVTLSCHTQPQWNIYIPINVKILTKVLVTNRIIGTGEPITTNDIIYEKQDKSLLTNGFFKDPKEVVGLVARYNMNTGTVLTKNNLKQLPIVKKDQTITLAVKTGGIEIKMLGIAKSDGYLNERINVLNPSSKKIIDAIVTSSTQAEINY